MRPIPFLLLLGLLPTWAADQPLGVAANVSFVSRYMAHGFQVTEGPAIQPSVTIDAALPGLQFTVWNSTTVDRQALQKDEYDFKTSYGRRFGEGWRTVDLRTFVNYWDKPHSGASTAAQAADGIGFPRTTGWKFNLGAALPEVLRVGPTTTGVSYDWFHWTPDPYGSFEPGSANEVATTTVWTLPETCPAVKTLEFRVWSDYHTGAFGVERGVGNVDGGIALPVAVAGCTVKAAVNYQRTLEETVAPRSGWWYALSLSRVF